MKSSSLKMRFPRASAVVVQHVPADRADWFMEWQSGVTEAAEGFAGYRSTEVYPPLDNHRDEWVVVINFDDEKSLQEWLDSPVRTQWIEKLRTEIGHFDLKALPSGFGPWFASLTKEQEGAPPPSWKIALTVLLGLYPTVMLLTLFPGPHIQSVGPAFAMLIGNAISVALLQWIVMPFLNIVLASWLKANSKSQKTFSVGGLFLIIALLICLAFLFRYVAG